MGVTRAKTHIDRTGIPLPQAVMMATLTPAHILGLRRTKCSLEPGKCADLLIVNGRMEPLLTTVRGRVV